MEELDATQVVGVCTTTVRFFPLFRMTEMFHNKMSGKKEKNVTLPILDSL